MKYLLTKFVKIESLLDNFHSRWMLKSTWLRQDQDVNGTMSSHFKLLVEYNQLNTINEYHQFPRRKDRRRTIVWLVPNWIVPNCERNHVSVTETGSLCLWHQTLQCVTLKQSSRNEIECFEPSHAKAQVKKHLKEVAFWLEFLRHPMPCRSCRAIWIYFSAQSERCSLPRRNRSRN